MAKDRFTGGEDAVWGATDAYINMRGPKGGFVAIGKALARGVDEQHANARLMAAAPEMLRALRMILRDESILRIDAVSRDAAFKAIARATGEG